MEELLISDEVQKVKEFCKEAKMPKHIRCHLGIKSDNSYRKRIHEPLQKAGKLILDPSRQTTKGWYVWNDNN